MNDSKKSKILLASIVFFMGFCAGLAVFLPLNRIKNVLASQLSKQSGMNVEISDMRFGTGLSLGLSKGALLGIHMKQITLVAKSGKSLACSHAILAPHLLDLFALKLKVGISCDLDSAESPSGIQSTFRAAAMLSPLYAPSQLAIDMELNGLELGPIIDLFMDRLPVRLDLRGKIFGDIALSNLPLLPGERTGMLANFNLRFTEFLLATLELQETPVFSTPLNLGQTDLKGSLDSERLSISTFKFNSDDLDGLMEMNFTLGANGMLRSGQWSGKVKTVADMPSRDLLSVLELNFGPVDPSGFRDFKKKFENGNLMALMNKPTE